MINELSILSIRLKLLGGRGLPPCSLPTVGSPSLRTWCGSTKLKGLVFRTLKSKIHSLMKSVLYRGMHKQVGRKGADCAGNS